MERALLTTAGTLRGYGHRFRSTPSRAPATQNTAVGYNALFNNADVDFNVAVGDSALLSFNGNTAFDGANTAVGSIALLSY